MTKAKRVRRGPLPPIIIASWLDDPLERLSDIAKQLRREGKPPDSLIADMEQAIADLTNLLGRGQ